MFIVKLTKNILILGNKKLFNRYFIKLLISTNL